MSRDTIARLAMLTANLMLFALTLDLKQNPLVPIGPGFYPRIVLGFTALLAALLAALDVLQRKKRTPFPAADYAAVLLHFAQAVTEEESDILRRALRRKARKR